MKEKICPLLAMATPPVYPPAECIMDRCAWYVPGLRSEVEGRCAIQMLGVAMPELIQGVR